MGQRDRHANMNRSKADFSVKRVGYAGVAHSPGVYRQNIRMLIPKSAVDDGCVSASHLTDGQPAVHFAVVGVEEDVSDRGERHPSPRLLAMAI